MNREREDIWVSENWEEAKVDSIVDEFVAEILFELTTLPLSKDTWKIYDSLELTLLSKT